jgi:hypothetical protein
MASAVKAEMDRWCKNDENDDHHDFVACNVYVSAGRKVEHVPILRR